MGPCLLSAEWKEDCLFAQTPGQTSTSPDAHLSIQFSVFACVASLCLVSVSLCFAYAYPFVAVYTCICLRACVHGHGAWQIFGGPS